MSAGSLGLISQDEERVMKDAEGKLITQEPKKEKEINEQDWSEEIFSTELSLGKKRRKVTTLYLLENEGFHSGKDEGNITKAAQRHDSNPAWLSASRNISPSHCKSSYLTRYKPKDSSKDIEAA